MPSVDQLTNEFYHWLTPEKLRRFHKNWVLQGSKMSTNVIERFADKLREKTFNFEQLLGWLQTKSIQELTLKNREDFYHLYVWMLDMIGRILIFRHINNVNLIRNSVKINQGIKCLLEDNEPLWIFSLNYDLIVEILASELNLPIKTGIYPNIFKVPLRNGQGVVISELIFNMMDKVDLKFNTMDFYKSGEQGINLLKIHGSLDSFLCFDAKKYVKLNPSTTNIEGWLKSLDQVNHRLSPPELLGRTTNEIAFIDYDGKTQFLRRTLLSGEYKFSNKISQNTPPELLEMFKQSLDYIDKLIIVGYGFCDTHINEIVENWMNSGYGKIVIIDPNIKTIPVFLQRFKSKISIKNITAVDWTIGLTNKC